MLVLDIYSINISLNLVLFDISSIFSIRARGEGEGAVSWWSVVMVWVGLMARATGGIGGGL